MTLAHAVSLPARPAPLTIDPTRTAVLVVDMQNDFGSAGGMFARAGIDISPIQAVVEPTSRVVRAARAAGSKIVYLKMEFRPDLSDIGGPASANSIRHRLFGVGAPVTAPDGTDGRVLIKGTWNTAIVEQLKPEPEDIVVSKQRFSGFYGTDLDTVLKTIDAKTLVFTGCTTSVCVESTLRDAAFRDYACVLLEDCTAEPMGADFPRTNHDASLLVIERVFGWVSDSAMFLDALLPAVVSTA